MSQLSAFLYANLFFISRTAQPIELKFCTLVVNVASFPRPWLTDISYLRVGGLTLGYDIYRMIIAMCDF